MQGVNQPQSGCIENTLDILGDKWTALIVRDLAASKARFCDLESSLQGISPRTLSQRLNKLEHERIVARRLYCEHPPRYTYELTHKGLELQDILIKMSEWGDRHNCQKGLA